MSSIYGIGYPTARPLGNAPAQSREQAGQRTTGVRSEQARPTAPAARPLVAPLSDAARESVSLEAPAGTDPELWKILSSEERGYFAKLGAMGPLTYGRAIDSQKQVPSVRGGRLDVKV